MRDRDRDRQREGLKKKKSPLDNYWSKNSNKQKVPSRNPGRWRSGKRRDVNHVPSADRWSGSTRRSADPKRPPAGQPLLRQPHCSLRCRPLSPQTHTQENVFDHQWRQLNTVHINMYTYNLKYTPHVARVVIIIIIRRRTYLWNPISEKLSALTGT